MHRYEDGTSAAQIGREIGVSTGSVTYQARKRGIIVRASAEVRKSITQERHLGNGLKLCPKCEISKETYEFYADHSKSDGLHRLCKLCLKARQNNYKLSRTKKQILSRKATDKRYRESARGMELAKKHSRKNSRTTAGRFGSSKCRAIRTGKGWTLAKEEYARLISKPCEYCRGPLPETSTGLDRLDNKIGYSSDNVVPCCSICNYARRDQFTPEEMRVFIGPAVMAVRKARGSKLEEAQNG